MTNSNHQHDQLIVSDLADEPLVTNPVTPQSLEDLREGVCRTGEDPRRWQFVLEDNE